MIALLDSSVLVAAHLPSHPHHGACCDWVRHATRGAYELVVAAHSLAEMYSVLTRLPLRPRISPQAAWQFIEKNVLSSANVVALSPDEYVSVLETAGQEGWTGGVIYDALIAKAATKASVERLITLNVSHFQRVWPAETARIASPETLPPPQLVNDR
jgi:predicted nucleic acid-binding protein